MKRFACAVFGAVFIAASAQASRNDEVTLVMVPREDKAVRVGMDIASRFPTLLISYKTGPGGAVSLHGWTGKTWVNIKPADFQDGSFFRTGPDSALIIKTETSGLLPEALIPPEAWCSAVYKIETTELRPMLHLTGQYYDFKYKDWEWFSKNYSISMEAINPEGLNIAWYHKRFQDHLAKKGAVGADDLQYWVAVRHPEPVIEAIAAETNEVDYAIQPEVDSPEDPEVVENPFTNNVPAAVVMGPSVAEEGGDDAELKEETE